MFNDPTFLQIALVVLGGLVLGRFVYRKDTEIENRRREAINVASAARGFGLEKIPDLLISYAVGDYSGIAYSLKQAAKLATNEKELLAELDGAFQKILAKKLETPEGVVELEKKLAEKKAVALK